MEKELRSLVDLGVGMFLRHKVLPAFVSLMVGVWICYTCFDSLL